KGMVEALGRQRVPEDTVRAEGTGRDRRIALVELGEHEDRTGITGLSLQGFEHRWIRGPVDPEVHHGEGEPAGGESDNGVSEGRRANDPVSACADERWELSPTRAR